MQYIFPLEKKTDRPQVKDQECTPFCVVVLPPEADPAGPALRKDAGCEKVSVGRNKFKQGKDQN